MARLWEFANYVSAIYNIVNGTAQILLIHTYNTHSRYTLVYHPMYTMREYFFLMCRGTYGERAAYERAPYQHAAGSRGIT